MRLCKVYLPGFERSLRFQQEFEVGRLTVLFGKNNAGKTNLLEDIYLMLATQAPSGGEGRIRRVSSMRTLVPRAVDQRPGYAVGAVYVELEPEFDFDRAVLDSFPQWEPVEEGVLRFSPLPARQVCYSGTNRDHPELWFTDVADFYNQAAEGFAVVEFGESEDDEDFIYEIDEQQRSYTGPFAKPLFLGWEFHEVDTWVTTAIANMTTVPAAFGGAVPAQTSWLELVDETLGEPVDHEGVARKWRIRPGVEYRLEQLSSLATDLLPDFLDGTIHSAFRVPNEWQALPAVEITYQEQPSSEARSLEDFGRGAARWMGIAVQTALRLMQGDPAITTLGATGDSNFSGHVLFIDEPEAHLHYSAVASVIRWCGRMVDHGFNVMVATHHDEFLRTPGEEATFVKVTRTLVDDPDLAGYFALTDKADSDLQQVAATTVRTIPTAATSALQELADEIGIHPAAALSLYRAILFVEGPLDEAVLDEYAGPALDAAGVTIVPIHGTKNLEGLIDGEFTARLGIKTGILTDNTSTSTMWDRSNRKRSSEEIKLVRLIKRFADRGLLPPKAFGVPEDDLLFALPPDAISNFLKRPFPNWHDLREECRAAEGRGPSDSVDWKIYALDHYGLPITTSDGVRRVVRALDLAGVELPSIRTAVNEIIAWATD